MIVDLRVDRYLIQSRKGRSNTTVGCGCQWFITLVAKWCRRLLFAEWPDREVAMRLSRGEVVVVGDIWLTSAALLQDGRNPCCNLHWSHCMDFVLYGFLLAHCSSCVKV